VCFVGKKNAAPLNRGDAVSRVRCRCSQTSAATEYGYDRRWDDNYIYRAEMGDSKLFREPVFLTLKSIVGQSAKKKVH